MLTVFVNPERCIGCLQCQFACAVEHSVSQEPAVAVWEMPPPVPRIHADPGRAAATAYPNRCRHCDPAPCLMVCPTAAIHRDPDHDHVLIDEAACINCAMCAIVCPFDVLAFGVTSTSGGRNVAIKCDGCSARLKRGDIPACVEACKVGALVFGDINELTSVARRESAETVLSATAAQPHEQPGTGVIGAWRTLAGATRSVGQAGGNTR